MQSISKASKEYKVFAQIGFVLITDPGVIISQGDKNNLILTVLFTIRDELISRIDLCNIAPHPSGSRVNKLLPIIILFVLSKGKTELF